MRYHNITKDDMLNGDGLRVVLWVAGCDHCCEGCHNPQTHAFDGGYEGDPDEILEQVKRKPLLRGITLSGGEPFCQPEPLTELAKQVHALGLDVVTYSGYTFEEILQHPPMLPLLEQTDILIDGRFELAKRDLLLHFRGSSNQRIIDMNKTRAAGKIVLWQDDPIFADHKM